MHCKGFVIFLVLVFLEIDCMFNAEPICTSKFDYDYKMLQKIVELEGKLQSLDDKLRQQQTLIDKMSTNGAGSVYVRWGKTSCPEDAYLIYSGYMAGKKHSDTGSGGNSLCLPSDPSWFNYTEDVDEWRGRVYGAEAETRNIFAYAVHNQDMSCAVCKTLRSAVLMIPGRTTCYPALRMEYSGYLMSAYHNHQSHDYTCVDSQPDFVPNGAGSADEHLLYVVEAICGILPCPPYEKGRELACVVCSI